MHGSTCRRTSLTFWLGTACSVRYMSAFRRKCFCQTTSRNGTISWTLAIVRTSNQNDFQPTLECTEVRDRWTMGGSFYFSHPSSCHWIYNCKGPGITVLIRIHFPLRVWFRNVTSAKSEIHIQILLLIRSKSLPDSTVVNWESKSAPEGLYGNAVWC